MSLGGGLAAIIAISHFAISHFADPAVASTVLAVLTIVGAVGNAVRVPVHLREGYQNPAPDSARDPEACRRLNQLFWRNIWLTVLWITWGVVALEHPSLQLWVKCLVTVPLYYLVTATAGETAALATRLNLRRGTTVFCQSKYGKRFETVLESTESVPGWGPFRKIVELQTQASEASAYAIGMAVLMIAMPAVELSAYASDQATRVVPFAAQVLQGPPVGPAGARIAGGSAGGPESTSPRAEPPPPDRQPPPGGTYSDHCPGGVSPGEPAPEPHASALGDLWLGGKVPGAGAIEAGCAQPAQRVEGHPDIWYAAGLCHGSLRSLGVSVAGREPALLYQQAARFAMARAKRGSLLGASPRVRLGAGDLYLVETVDGTYVLIRAVNATGTIAREGSVRSCADSVAINAPYTEVPPGLIGAWYVASRAEPAFPIEIAGRSGTRRFVFLDGHTGQMATATCTTDIECTLFHRGAAIPSMQMRQVTLSAILTIAPGAVARSGP